MNKHKIINRKTSYKSTKIQIDTLKIQLPNGNIDYWDVKVSTGSTAALPVKDKKVYMTKEWRTGAEDIVTQFTMARARHDSEEENLSELKLEVKEELGITGGNYTKTLSYLHGTRSSGYRTVYLVENFEIGEPDRDENEIQEIITLPIKGLFHTLSNNHITTAETLLLAKILEDKFL